MSICASLNILRLKTNLIVPLYYAVQVNGYAKPGGVGGKMGGKMKGRLKMGVSMEKKVLPVETDTHKLRNFVCGSNILNEGSDIEVKPDSEYPDWLWNIHIGDPLKLEDLDPESKLYWKRVKKAALRRHNLLSKLKSL